MTLSPNPTNHDNMSFTFLATNVEPICKPHQEASEDIKVHILEREDVVHLLEKGEIVQALHAAPLWKYFSSKQ
jgi:ADP-ribose pyrophosphatase